MLINFAQQNLVSSFPLRIHCFPRGIFFSWSVTSKGGDKRYVVSRVFKTRKRPSLPHEHHWDALFAGAGEESGENEWDRQERTRRHERGRGSKGARGEEWRTLGYEVGDSLGWDAPGQTRPGNALDAASSRRMSHRRYGKPVRLGYKDPAARFSAPLRSQHRAGVFSATLLPGARCYHPSLSLPLLSSLSLQAVSTFLSVLSFSFPFVSFPAWDTEILQDELWYSAFGILNCHFTALFVAPPVISSIW